MEHLKDPNLKKHVLELFNAIIKHLVTILRKTAANMIDVGKFTLLWSLQLYIVNTVHTWGMANILQQSANPHVPVTLSFKFFGLTLVFWKHWIPNTNTAEHAVWFELDVQKEGAEQLTWMAKMAMREAAQQTLQESSSEDVHWSLVE